MQCKAALGQSVENAGKSARLRFFTGGLCREAGQGAFPCQKTRVQQTDVAVEWLLYVVREPVGTDSILQNRMRAPLSNDKAVGFLRWK